jgi:transposase
LSCLNLNAAGVDIGATEIYIAVPGDRDPQPVRCFSTFTEDLHAAAAWLKACHIETVAMESTGVYWIPLFQILEARGFKVFLVNAQSRKECSGTQVRCIRLPMAAVFAFGGLTARIVPAGTGGLELASWLGLCPDNRISGGKVLSVKTRKVKNRAATALRMAAQSLHRSQSFLGNFYRRMRTKLGAPKAITATAHKLARILYHMVTTGHAYDETICAQNEVQNRKRMEARLRKQAREFGLQLVAL